MVWPDERIEKYTDGYRVVATDDDDADCKWWQSQMFLAMQEVRGEYEDRIETLMSQLAMLRQEDTDRKYIEREIARGESGGMLY